MGRDQAWDLCTRVVDLSQSRYIARLQQGLGTQVKNFEMSDADRKIVSPSTCCVFQSHSKCLWKSGKESCAGAITTNTGFYSTVHCKYQRLYLVQNENCRDGRKPLGSMCGRRMRGRRGQRQLSLVKKCRG